MRDLVVNTVERRSAKRVNLNLRSRLRHSGFEHGELIIRDLSFTGFRGETDIALDAGAIVSVHLPNIGLVRATVKWIEEGIIAGAFHRPVDVRSCFRRPTA